MVSTTASAKFLSCEIIDTRFPMKVKTPQDDWGLLNITGVWRRPTLQVSSALRPQPE